MNEDELFHELFHVPLKIFRIYHAGDYERENLVLIAGEECYLSDYVLFQMVYGEDSLPDYSRSHFLTFDEIPLSPGERVRIYTCRGEDHEEIGVTTGKHYHVLYWNLDAPIWSECDNEVKIQQVGDGYSKCFNPSGE